METLSRSRFRRRRTVARRRDGALRRRPARALRPPPAPQRDRDAAGLGSLGNTVLTAIASTTNADEALGALGNGLALIEARRRIDADAAAAAKRPSAGPSPEARRRSRRPLEAAARLGRLQRHRGPAPQRRRRREDLRPHAAPAAATRPRSCSPASPSPRPTPREAVKDVINNANTIVGRPYIWGGGHGSFYSYGYDCSGSVSFALFGGGLIPRPAHLRRRSRAGAPPAPANGSPSTPTPATPSPRSPACAGTRSATSRAPAPAGTSPPPPPPASSPATRRATRTHRRDLRAARRVPGRDSAWIRNRSGKRNRTREWFRPASIFAWRT